MKVLGIDVGGSGIKGAVVDTTTGALVTDRCRITTPVPASPVAMGKVVARIVHHFEWKGPVGCGMPGPIKQGVVLAAANLDESWPGTRAEGVYSKAIGRRVIVVNDADAAGMAEMQFGAGKGQRGVVVIVTLGTGIGSSLFVDGLLVPNTELGQMDLRGKRAEVRASARVRKEKDLSWQQWSRRVTEFLRAVDLLLWPDLIIVGGGVSKKANKFIPYLDVRANVVPAKLFNEAGIVGAALAAQKDHR